MNAEECRFNVDASAVLTDRKQASKRQLCQVPTALSLAAKLSGDKAAPEVSSEAWALESPGFV